MSHDPLSDFAQAKAVELGIPLSDDGCRSRADDGDAPEFRNTATTVLKSHLGTRTNGEPALGAWFRR